MVKQISLNLDGDVKQVVNVNSVFARHETFHPRFGWIKKGFDAALNSFVFVQEDAPVRLGVGKNMVSSIRYWCNAFKVLENDRPSDFGDRLLKDDGWDPYLEDPASIPVLGVEHFELLAISCLISLSGILATLWATCDNNPWGEVVCVNGANGNNAGLWRNSVESCSHIRITQ